MGHKLVVLSLGQGDLERGFLGVSAQLTEEGTPQPMKFRGGLPAAPQLIELYRSWQSFYSALYRRLDWCPRLEIEATEDVTNVSEQDFERLCQKLTTKINAWLNSELFRPIEQQLRTYLNSLDEIRFVIETHDPLLRRLPWHRWSFFEDYRLAEVALSAPEYKRAAHKSLLKTPGTKIRILAIFGDSTGVDLSKERALLEQLSDTATKFLVEPQPKELNDQLWKQGWDILFFAGHSSSQAQGWIKLNPTDAISLDHLRNALKKAISCGLKLAIFNSCDGLALAQSLEDLHIPQTIVWREPVPDVVAQEFFQYFLDAFSEGRTLYTAVREARERLEKIEGKYPCATWLPVICQNPAEEPTRWQQWSGYKKRDRVSLKRHLRTALIASLVVTALVAGVRYLGWLQPFELQAFDRLMHLRPAEPPDQRFLIVTIDEADIQYQQQGMQMRWSLADAALEQLLEKLEPYQPRTIGLDIYRDFPVDPNYPELATRLQQDDRFFAVCKVAAPSDGAPEGTPPPPEVPLKRASFSDFVADDGDIARRQLLGLTPPVTSPCAAEYAFSLLLALHYLEAEGIEAELSPAGELKIGSVAFKRLEPHTGGYQGVDARGYQVLLNYRSLDPQTIAPTVPLRKILEDQLAPQVVQSLQDRIVLIGVTAPSTNDYWKTPYSTAAASQEIPGVFIQAQMTSQILSAVQDGRPLIWWWSFWTETLWIWGWAAVGAVLAWLRQPLYSGLATSTALLLLFGICLGIFIQAGWIPLVPAALALVATQVAVLVWRRSPAGQTKVLRI